MVHTVFKCKYFVVVISYKIVFAGAFSKNTIPDKKHACYACVSLIFCILLPSTYSLNIGPTYIHCISNPFIEFKVVLNCIIDIHRNVFMWGQQDLIKKEGSKALELSATRTMSGNNY